VLTNVNEFAFRSEILYLCITEVEIAHEIRVISTFLSQKSHFWGQKISYIVFSRLNNGFTMLLIVAPRIDIITALCMQNVKVC
jgi:hypothetical protein